MKQKREVLRFKDYMDWRSVEDSGLPQHQLERGLRYGNQRKSVAKEKVAERRRERHQEKRGLGQE